MSVHGKGRGRAARKRGAFTLLEMMVAMFVFAMVLTSLYMTWRVLFRSNAAAIQLAASAQRKRLAVQTIEEALNAAVMFGASATNYAFMADAGADPSSITFVAHLGSGFPGSGRFDGESVRRLWFGLETGPNGESELVMRQASMLSVLDSQLDAHPTVLCRGVREFQVQFWDERQGEFLPEWPRTNRLPVLVRLRLGFSQVGEGPGRQNVESVTRTVRIPSSGVGPESQVGIPGNPPR